MFGLFELFMYFICVLSLILSGYFTLKSYQKPVKNAYFGIKMPADVINSDEVIEIVQRFTSASKRYLLISFALSLPFLFKYEYVSVYILMITIYMFVGSAFLQIPYVKAYKEMKALKQEKNYIDGLEEENNWILGMFYYNKNDKRIFIESLYMKTNFTVNMATNIGKWLSVFIVVGVLALFMLLFAICYDEIIHPRINVVNAEKVRITSALYGRDVLISDIMNISMITEEDMPKGVKINGMSTQKVLRGNFNTRDGKALIFVNRGDGNLIKIETSDFTIFINTLSPAEIESIFHEIRSLL